MIANKNQRIVLGIGLLLVILNGLFPPFAWSQWDGDAARSHQGYRFLFAAPYNSKIIFTRFLVQIITIVAATAGAFIFYGMRNKEEIDQDEINRTTKPVRSGDQSMMRPESPEKSIAQVKLPDDFEQHLRSSVSGFISKEFQQSSRQDRERAESYIHGKLHFAAQHHYAEQSSIAGFDVAAQIEKLATRFGELKQPNNESLPIKQPVPARKQSRLELESYGIDIFCDLCELLQICPSRQQWEREFQARKTFHESIPPDALDELLRT